MGFDPKRKPMLIMREWWNGRHDTLRGYCSLGRAGSSPAPRTICEVSATGERTCLTSRGFRVQVPGFAPLNTLGIVEGKVRIVKSKGLRFAVSKN